MDDDDEEEDVLDGPVMDEENRLVGVIGLGTKTFGDVRGETGAERAPGLVGLAVFFLFLFLFCVFLWCSYQEC